MTLIKRFFLNGERFENIYLHKKGWKMINQREVCIRLVQNGLLKDIYPQLSLSAEIFLIAPISTAAVERNFSAMNRILTKLCNQLTTRHLDELIRVSIEDPNTLSETIKGEIINCWKLEKQRRLQVKIGLCSFPVFFLYFYNCFSIN